MVPPDPGSTPSALTGRCNNLLAMRVNVVYALHIHTADTDQGVEFLEVGPVEPMRLLGAHATQVLGQTRKETRWPLDACAASS